MIARPLSVSVFAMLFAFHFHYLSGFLRSLLLATLGLSQITNYSFNIVRSLYHRISPGLVSAGPSQSDIPGFWSGPLVKMLGIPGFGQSHFQSRR